MNRLIEIENPEDCPSPVSLRAGDVLVFRATGGRVTSGADAVEMLGPFIQAVADDLGGVMEPAGGPSAVLFRAGRAGRASVEVITGDPWRGSRTTTLILTIAD